MANAAGDRARDDMSAFSFSRRARMRGCVHSRRCVIQRLRVIDAGTTGYGAAQITRPQRGILDSWQAFREYYVWFGRHCFRPDRYSSSGSAVHHFQVDFRFLLQCLDDQLRELKNL